MSSGNNKQSGRLLLGLALAALALVPFLLPFWLFGAGWWDEFADLGHFLGFAVLALILVSSLHRIVNPVSWRVVLTAVIVAIASFGTEYIQQALHEFRSGSLDDAIRNLWGGVAGILIYLVYRATINRRPLSWLAGCAVLIVLAVNANSPLYTQWKQEQQRAEKFPVLLDFSTRWERNYATSLLARKLITGTGKPLFMFPLDRGTGVRLDRIWSDWSGHNALQMNLHADTPNARVPLNLYIVYVDDLLDLELNWGRAEISLHPGENTLIVPFDEIIFEGEAVDFESVKVQYIDIGKSRIEETLHLTIEEVSLLK